MKKEEDFDDIFKKGLGEGAGPAYREEDWNALAGMLDTPQKKLGLLFWIPVLSSAAILLIAFGWWVLRPENAQNSATRIQGQAMTNGQKLKTDSATLALATRKDVRTADKNDASSRNEPTHERLATRKDVSTADDKDSGAANKIDKDRYNRLATRKDVSTADHKDSSGVTSQNMAINIHTHRYPNKTAVVQPDVLAANDNGYLNHSKGNGKRKHRDVGTRQKSGVVEPADNDYAVNANADQSRDTVQLVAYSHGLTSSDYSNAPGLNALSIQSVAITAKPKLLPIKRSKPVIKSGGRRPQYALSVVGAPEVNGVNSLSQTSAGTNLGVLFSVELFNKLFVSTGGMYSVKPYNSEVAGYGYNASLTIHKVTSVNANCHVLDIPLNLDYQFYNKHLNHLSVGTGLSSYVMLYEHYQYNYANPDVNGPINKTIPQTNKYIFGVLNLQATYTRQVTANVGISLQPYMKLPLTGIGATGAKLQTAGFAIGLNWNLRSNP